MTGLSNWLQQNPILIIIMFMVSVVSAAMTILLGWKQFYTDYLSKTVVIPIWLFILIFIFVSIVSIVFKGVRSSEEYSKELELIEGKQFGVQQIVLDGKNFQRCDFDGTELIFEGKKGFSLVSCKFSSPRFTFSKYAGNTINILTAMYQDPAMRPLIEGTIENIKTGKNPQSKPVMKLNE